MALVSMRELLDHAAANGYGIPAFNVNNLEQVQAVMMAADEVGAPVILQASAGARKYAGEPFIKHLIQAAIGMTATADMRKYSGTSRSSRSTTPDVTVRNMLKASTFFWSNTPVAPPL